MTLGTAHSLLLLAQRSRWHHLGDRFGGSDAGVDVTDVVLLAAVIAVAVIGVFVLRRYSSNSDGRGAYDNPRQLFSELCRTHNLRYADRRLIMRLAGRRGLAHPSLAFVTPECFDVHALPVEMAADAQRVMQLRLRLFRTA